MKISRLLSLLLMGFFFACRPATQEKSDLPTLKTYFAHTNKEDVLTGGVRMIPIETPKGTFKVWTKRVGNNPRMKLLLLHGGPGANHAYFEAFDSFLPQEGIEYYYYDQLGSALSEKPKDSTLWTIEHFVEEVEQVRQALDLDKDNFYILGHSWGGMLGIEYALKYQENLKGLIISNMMSSIPAYVDYAQNVLGPQFGKKVYDELMELENAKEYDNPRYLELIYEHHYPQHVIRFPLDAWPEPVSRGFEGLNADLYVYMQGVSEFGVTEGATLADWDRSGDLGKITVPTLTIGAEFDTMDPKHMEEMAEKLPKGSYLYCPQGSHFAMYDDQQTYFKGVIQFMKEVNGVE
ncbi:MAG: proline iminopeptidase-family hydrolase [Bacteroidota bacterium]